MKNGVEIGWRIFFFQVSALGLGCRSLTSSYENPPSEEDAIAVIHHAYHNGVTFFDTSDFYGPHSNEVFLGKVGNTRPAFIHVA